jgi:hypothetical protein
MTRNPDTHRLLVATDHVARRLRRLAAQADMEAAAIESSIGFVGSGSDAPVSGGSPSSVVERTALGRELAAVQRWDRAKQRWARLLEELDHCLTALVPADEAEWQAPGSGSCLACQRWVSGSAEDRLRSGMCNACRQWVRRHMEAHHLERGDAIAARRRMLADDGQQSA